MRLPRRDFFLGMASLSLLGLVGCTEDNEKASGILDQKGSAGPGTGGPVNYNMKPPSGPDSLKGMNYPGADKAAAATKPEEKKEKAAEK